MYGRSTQPVRKPKTFHEAKLIVPLNVYSTFPGRLMGPGGMTKQQMELETDTKIMLRGRGSMRKEKEDECRGLPGYEEDMHVIIQCFDTYSGKEKMDRAIFYIKRLFDPKECNDIIKKEQLLYLAKQRGTYQKRTNYVRHIDSTRHSPETSSTQIPTTQTTFQTTSTQTTHSTSTQTSSSQTTAGYLQPAISSQPSASSSFPSNDQTNESEIIYTCGICYENYGTYHRQPVSLVCGHTICLFCIKNVSSDGIITCPFCKKEVPTLGADAGKNILLMELMKEHLVDDEDDPPQPIVKEKPGFYNTPLVQTSYNDDTTLYPAPISDYDAFQLGIPTNRGHSNITRPVRRQQVNRPNNPAPITTVERTRDPALIRNENQQQTGRRRRRRTRRAGYTHDPYWDNLAINPQSSSQNR